jgi:uncharacterized damage-inducible protein DinB
MNRPDRTEFAPYYDTYISLIEGDNVFPVLEAQISDLRTLFFDTPEERGTFAYAEGKWTIKEVLSHIIDGERIFAYRILRVSRGDETPMEGFEQDDYIATSNANNRTFADLLDEFEHQRSANLLMIRNISDEAAKRLGIASGNKISARALAYILAGHVTHHLRILRERYLAK